jgi:TP901 family phage tail tape measure protein
MAKQLNADLRVRAETDEAKKKLAELQRQLAGIQSTPTHLFDDQDLKKASQAAAELSKHIQNATNADTGKLDLTRFASSLKKSNKELKDYRQDLERLGPAGQQAFLSIARSITNAEAPTVRLTQRMNEFLTTMKNTARWQISSSILHGFMGTVQSAFGYAQDLNKSLNDIRIVTGKSTEEMAAFAKEANKSAVALSTSTTSYTDAALIFYQQGLSDEEVKKRTDVTAKMANVTGEAAEQVSSYMTAIWNNFNKAGDESEQHFADILTALGAATASSSAEIAGGLEKFAAIADATGLSYDYAASALATLVSNTRQSEDVVGTSLKTIFSRIQGVSLGETLEDGVDLNKYSEALEKIGVNVLDLDGNMRDLDDILDDTAVKWETLSRAEQMATAQTVAGVRQYNQFISLMDNWDDMEANLDIARSADGSLEEQADIYAESWEAARKRVQASLQAIYQELVNDEFFIDLNNGLAQTIDIIGGLLDGLGGVKGLLGIIGGLITQHFAKELPAAMERLKENAIYLSGFGDKINKKAQNDVSSNLSAMPVNTENNTWNVEVQGAQKLSELKEQLLQKQNQMSEAERASAQAIMQQAEADYQRLGILAQIADQKKAALEATKNEIATQATQQESDRVQGETGKGFDTSTFKEQKKLIKETVNELQGYYKALAQIKQQGKIFKDQAAQYKKNNTSLKDMKKAVSEFLIQPLLSVA